MIQFFQQKGAKTGIKSLDILASYRDHRHDDRMIWSIFDIRAMLPDNLQLLHHQFDAGKYVLRFTDGRQKIDLYRWAPASFLLEGRDLIQFSKTIPEFAESEPLAVKIDGYQAAEWRLSPGTRWRRRWSRLKIKPSFFWLRLWLLEDQNRILCVRAESKHPLDAHQLTRICRDYESF